MSTIARDISEQKAAERRLAESARHFELINDLVATCGFDGYFKRLNEAWEPTLGWTPERAASRSRSSSWFTPRIARRSRPRSPGLRAARPRPSSRSGSGRATGAWVWTEWSASPDADAGLFYCVGREITERMEAERVRAAERRQFADAQQIASVGSWELDLETGERTLVGAALPQPRLRARPAPPPRLEELLERIHPEDREVARERLGGCARARASSASPTA